MSDAPKAVFVSYAREDTASAQRIAEALRAHGVEVWFDQNELRGGDAWDQKIRRQINECTLFLPVISRHTQERGKGYFRLEWKLAVEQTHLMAEGIAFLAPVVIDDTTESGAVVPPEFLRVQWTRLSGALPTTQFVEQIKRLLDVPHNAGARRPAFSVAASAETAKPTSVPPPSKTPLPAVAVIAVLAISAAVFLWLRRPAAESEKNLRPEAAATPIPSPAATKVADKSIAVLPFVNMGADKADEYLGDGMTEELLNALAKVKGLRVPGRSSSFAFKGRTDDDIFRQVGEKLHVNTVLEGSVRKVGDKIRITAQLINCTDGNHLWSEEYDRNMADLLAVQTEVAQQVAQKLQVALGVEETRALAKTAAENPEAHRLYLLGRYQFSKSTREGWMSARQYFEQAIQLEPTYARAYCGLADTYGWLGGNVLPFKEAWAKDKAMAQKALELDPSLAEAHASLGVAWENFYEWKESEKELRRAIELDPNLAFAHDQLAFVLNCLGHFDEALKEGKIALQLDPLALFINMDFGWYLYCARRFDEALAQARKTLELDPNNVQAIRHVGVLLGAKGDVAAGIAELEKARALDEAEDVVGALGYAYAIAGNRPKAEQALRDLDELAKSRFVTPGQRMITYLGLGEKDQALDWLEKCYEAQDGACWWLKVDPIYDPLRREPRFQALLKKAGFDR